MKKYKKGNACKKCGHREAKTQYLYYMDINLIKRMCNNCGYWWNELPLDYKEKEKKE